MIYIYFISKLHVLPNTIIINENVCKVKKHLNIPLQVYNLDIHKNDYE